MVMKLQKFMFMKISMNYSIGRGRTCSIGVAAITYPYFKNIITTFSEIPYRQKYC